MKIVFLIRSLDLAGAERQLVFLARGLANLGHSISLIVYYSGGPLEKWMKENTSIPIYSMEKKGRNDIFGFCFRLLKQIQLLEPDIIYSFLSTSNIFASLIRLRYPKIRVVWGVRASNVNLDHYGSIAKAVAWTEARLSDYTDLIIANSYTGRKYAVQKGFKKHNFNVIQNGIDTEIFRPSVEKRQTLRKEWNIEPNTLLVGCIARLDPMKDHETFFKMAALLKNRLPNVRFVCVGKGTQSYQEALKTIVQKLGLTQSLFWAGLRLDTDAVYNACDLVCLSSSSGEGFPNVLGEAMSTGIPCVATDVGDSRLILGDKGIVVPPNNPKLFMEACFKVLTEKPFDPAEIRNRIVDNFSLEAMVDKTEQMLAKI